MSRIDNVPINQGLRMERYYRFHSRIYDATRWSFLFGRQKLLEAIPGQPQHILEVGCGTGKNLLALAQRFPQAEIVGVDISETMLNVARRKLGRQYERVWLLHQPYDSPLKLDRPFDLVVFSYSLTMINPGWYQAIENAYNDLTVGGLIAVVDFHDAPLPAFKQWMQVNHVRMEGHLLPQLAGRFQSTMNLVRRAYGGVWQYFMFVGVK